MKEELVSKQFLAGVAIIATVTSQAVEIVKEARPVAKIYLAEFEKPDDSHPFQGFEKLPIQKQKERLLSVSVADLNYHLRKMCGAELEIVVTADPSQVKVPAIVLGSLANRLGAQPQGTSELGETFRLKCDDSLALVGGESPAACAYGVYELLSRLGCDWVMPGINGEVIPEKKDIRIAGLDVEQGPSFAVRCPWYSGGDKVVSRQRRDEFDQWKLRHKEQITREWHPLIMLGGHVWGTIIHNNKKQFESKPEMLAMVRQPDGAMKRQGPQLETTNPEVLELLADHIRGTFKTNNWPNDKSVCVGVGPSDGGGFSESAESVLAGSNRLDPMSGDPDITDLQVLLCNQLIKRLDGEFPNLRLGFYLYNTHADYPMRHTPDKKVTIVLADITYSRFHGLNDPTSKTRAYYRDILAQWEHLHHKQGNNIFFRGYNWNLAENFLPYTKLKIWGEDIPYYKKMGVIGLYNEYSKAWSVLGPSDYLEAKLTWDATRDWKQILAQYCANAFGKGASFLEKYYLMLAERQSRSGQEAGSYHAFALVYDNKFVQEASALFAKAEEAAEKPAEKQRVAFARIPLDMLRQYLDFRAAYSAFDFPTARQKFDLMKSELQRYETIDPNLVCRSAARYLDRFYGKFVEDGVKYSTGKYRILQRLPDRLKTAFDANNCGQSMGFFKTEINDSDYICTATFSSTWDAQGLMGYRFGSVWYRVHFTVPDGALNEPLGLFIGGADSVVRVWVNDTYVGMGQGFAKPFQFDLTELVKDGENVLAIQVQRFGNSEIGTGGLIYPSFVFAGPRLDSRAPKLEKLERVLPGGEREAAAP